MKKIIAIIMILTMCISMTACGGSSAEDLAGTYKNITFLPNIEYTLYEDTTFEGSRADDKGTFEGNSSGGFTLQNAYYSNNKTEFKVKDSYYYRTSGICCFEEDGEFGLVPTFDDNGRSKQWFDAYYDSISDTSWKVIVLSLDKDGTFRLKNCVRDMSGGQSDGTVYEGTYSLDNYILNLNCDDGTTMPFLFINDKIYFDVYEKQN